MMLKDPVKTTRDLDVVQIPEGHRVRLARGTEVRVMQALGDSLTVMTAFHTMVRIDGKDADAIGETVAAPAGAPVEPSVLLTAEQIKDRAWHAMRSVYDPEIPVNVVDLGLVYACEVEPQSEEGFRVKVVMTLTAPGCGMGGVLKEDAERRLRAIPGVKQAEVEVVVEPPWDQSMMSEAARLELGL